MDRNKLCYLREYKADNYIYELSERHIIYELANLKQLTFEVTDACNSLLESYPVSFIILTF
jgi:uncharacterized protein